MPKARDAHVKGPSVQALSHARVELPFDKIGTYNSAPCVPKGRDAHVGGSSTQADISLPTLAWSYLLLQ